MERMRKTRKVSFAAKAALLLVSVWAAFTIVSLQLKIMAKESEMSELQQQIDAQKLENRQIQDVLDSGDDAEYIARIAREKLGYISPGQKVFVDISSK